MPKPPEPPEPPIHRAARLGDTAALDSLVGAGAQIDARADLEVDNGPWLRSLTPLMVAARSIDGATVDTLKWLLHHGANLRAVSEAGVTAAWYAAGNGGRWAFHEWRLLDDHVERLRFLLDAGLDPHETGFNGRSLLGEACRVGDPARVRLLLDRGVPAEPKFNPANNVSVLESLKKEAAKYGFDPSVFESLPMPRADALDAYQIPLFQAAEGGSPECVRMLIERGGDVHRSDSQSRTALWYAGSVDAARALLDAGAKLTGDAHADVLQHFLEDDGCCDGECRTDERTGIAALLIERGAGLDGAGGGWSRLRSCAFRRSTRGVEFLLASGRFTPADATDALLGVCWQGESGAAEDNVATERIIRALVAAGADVNALVDDSTAMLEAVFGDWSSPTAVRVLLELGADPNLANPAGITPLMMAAEQSCLESIKLLIASGARIDALDHEGQSAIDKARRQVETWQEIVRNPDPHAFEGMIPDEGRAERHADALKKAEEALRFLESPKRSR